MTRRSWRPACRRGRGTGPAGSCKARRARCSTCGRSCVERERSGRQRSHLGCTAKASSSSGAPARGAASWQPSWPGHRARRFHTAPQRRPANAARAPLNSGSFKAMVSSVIAAESGPWVRATSGRGPPCPLAIEGMVRHPDPRSKQREQRAGCLPSRRVARSCGQRHRCACATGLRRVRACTLRRAPLPLRRRSSWCRPTRARRLTSRRFAPDLRAAAAHTRSALAWRCNYRGSKSAPEAACRARARRDS